MVERERKVIPGFAHDILDATHAVLSDSRFEAHGIKLYPIARELIISDVARSNPRFGRKSEILEVLANTLSFEHFAALIIEGHELASNLNEMQKRKLLFVAAQNEITRARINWADVQIEFIVATSRRDPTEKIQALTEYQAKLVEHVRTS